MQEGSIAMIDQEEHNIVVLDMMAQRILSIEDNVMSFAVSGAIEIGNILIEAKELVKYGEWGDWCKNNLNYSQRKAERYMKIATTYGDENRPFSKSTNLSKVSIHKALSLLALPDEEVENFVEEHDVETMSAKDIDAEIKKLKEEKDKALASADAWKKMKEDTDNALAMNEQAMEEMQNHITQLKAELRIKESEQAPEIDVTEYEEKIGKLQAAVDKAKEKERKLKDQFKQLENSKQEDIDEAVAAQRESLYEQVKAEYSVEMEHEHEINAELQTEVEGLRKKLQNNTAESKLRFKILVDQLQDTFNECMNVISDEEEETAGRMKGALQKVLFTMSEVL